MTEQKLKSILAIGETVAVEFKRCGNGIESDTYETVCSFLNRFGGDLFLGVENDGNPRGVPPNAADDMITNFINMVSNPDVISPTVYLTPKKIKYKGKTIIHIQVLPSSEVHTYKKVIYDRNNDKDVKVTSTSRIAALYIRKQRIFTEQRVFPHVTKNELQLDMMPRLRQMAANRQKDHPWKNMDDDQIIMSAKLYGEDMETGKKGYSLAGVLLLGTDDAVRSVAPAYRTDALLRKINVDRYDDRVIVQSNLINSYYQLMQFAEKHLLNKFYLEKDISMDLRSIISREILVNTLMHREYSSSFYSKFVIERERMYTENANRALDGQSIKPDSYEPLSKNPIIANFFRNIGFADELGSGTRNLYHYVPFYSGKPPEMIDGDIFRQIIPLDDEYSFDANMFKVQDKAQQIDLVNDPVNGLVNETQRRIIVAIRENGNLTYEQLASTAGVSTSTIKRNIKKLYEMELIKRVGSDKTGHWIIHLKNE